MNINFDGAPAPEQEKPNDAGYDLRASCAISIPPNGRALVKTALRVAIPPSHVGMVCSRSGLALKKGVYVLNAPGIVDSGYRGEIGVVLRNTGDQYFDVSEGDRVAQLLFVPVTHPQFVFGILDETERGAGGFGSTGISTQGK
jgi:dUTP pyrophosphatase